MLLDAQPAVPRGQRRIMLALLLLCLLVVMSAWAQDATHRVNLPMVVKGSTAPKASRSYYITDISSLPRFQLKGCVLALDLQQKDIVYGFIAFFLGRPAYLPDSSSVQGEYGTIAVGETPLDLLSIKEAIKLWMQGFVEGFHDLDPKYECGLRSDANVPRPHVTLALATTNEPLKVDVPTNSVINLETPSLEGHGQAWGSMIRELNNYVFQHGWQSMVKIVGGNDIEIGFNTPAATKEWIKGYRSATFYEYYYLGDCAGCPNPRPWTPQDLWDVTRGVDAPIVPQIYRVDGEMAVQWSRVDRLLRDTPDPVGDFPDSRLPPMNVWGVLTQHQACDDQGERYNVSGRDYCTIQGSVLYNTPEQAWNQLTDQYQAQRLGQPFSKATDVGYTWDYSSVRKP